MSFVVRKFVDAIKRKEVQPMYREASYAKRVIQKRIAELENELEPPIKLTLALGGQLSVRVDPRELDVQQKLEKYGVAYEPPLERPEVKAELYRLRLLEVTNPAQAYREITYSQPNRLIDIVNLPPKPAKESAPIPQQTKIQNAMQKIEEFHRINKLMAKHLQIPVLKAKLVEFNQFHKQALEEQALDTPCGVFTFTCPYCQKEHQIGVNVPEWHLRKTYIRAIYCSPNSSEHRLAFELEGIPEEVK